MSYTTQVPSASLTPQGFVAPFESDILPGVLADLDAALGGGMDPSLTTPQGQLAQSFTAIIGDKDAQFLALANGVDPALSYGRLQDAIGRIYFMSRIAATPTVLTVICIGASGVRIVAGQAMVVDGDGNLYVALSTVTIPFTGTVNVSFAAVVYGPTPVPTQVAIYQTVAGWDTASVASGTVGQSVETPSEFELRRQQSVAANARASLESIRGAVLGVNGVKDAYVTENTSSAPLVLSNVTLSAHSVFVCVDGGSDADVAQAIYSKKPPGCAMNGSSAVTVVDGSYAVNPPTYTITFQRASQNPVTILVTLKNSVLVPANVRALVQQACYDTFHGTNGSEPVRIGSTIYASQFYCPVLALGPWVQIISITVGYLSDTPTATFSGSIGTALLASTALTVGAIVSGGTVAIGASLFSQGPNAVLPGSRIAGQTSGAAGGSGVYTVAVDTLPTAQYVATENMAIALPNQNSITAHVDEIPTLALLDTNIVLQ